MANKDKDAAAAGTHLIAKNRRAWHDYEILDTYEAGLALLGTEVKALRLGKANLSDGYARIESGQAFLHSVRIEPYGGGNRFNHDPERARKMLLNRGEIGRIIGKTEEKGLTLIPLRLYFKRGIAKVEIGIVRGKKQYDRRREIAKRDSDRAIDRALAEKAEG
ncbi:MAG TPA: SsrA-binding protein SmpB [Candidatus Latescibacteria bacterium]|jgi:SsrA-binding protein|nr:SsrA-binding protein [Gemmatimonadaceae bacterium]HJP31764.1 SsrA-binding protein SmpB [Candidatus Latescibacterota bacterium]|tara:strand:- start:463 stop:951 length:489 start_codon:yes stop_codon:yes gene_type:complete